MASTPPSPETTPTPQSGNEGQHAVTRSPENPFPLLDRHGLMVTGITHNLFGSLTAILGHLDLLSMMKPELSDQLQRIVEMGKRMRSDIQMMLEKAELEALPALGKIDMVRLVERELDFHRADPRLKHQIEKTFHHDETIPVFIGPYGDFIQAFDQILMNAIEALEDAQEKKMIIRLTQGDSKIMLSIRDTGAGMDANTLAHAFDPFFTTKRAYREGRNPPTLAMGLGLTHAKNLLEPLGCSLAIESTPGEGTVVRLTIPWEEINEKFSKEYQAQPEKFGDLIRKASSSNR